MGRKGSARGFSSKGFGKRDRSQPQGGFQKVQKGGRKGFRKGSGKHRRARGNDQARGQPVKKSAFQKKKLGRTGSAGQPVKKATFQSKIGKFARRGALRKGQRDGERRKGAGKGKGGSNGGGFMARRKSTGRAM